MLRPCKGSSCLELTLSEQTRAAPVSFQHEVVENMRGVDSKTLLSVLPRYPSGRTSHRIRRSFMDDVFVRGRPVLKASTFILIFSVALRAGWVPGSLRGKVTDGSGTAVSGVVVAAITEQGRVKVGVTDAQGDYTIDKLSPGRYEIWAGGNGFSVYENTSLGVRAGRALTLNICLRPSPEPPRAIRLEMVQVRAGGEKALVSTPAGTGANPVAWGTPVTPFLAPH
jgi:hypothetical protein